MKIYVIDGVEDGYNTIMLVTTNIEKAKAFIISNGWVIEVWEDDVRLCDISYYEEEGFLVTEVNNEIS